MVNPALTYTPPDIETHLGALLPDATVWVVDALYEWPFWTVTYQVRVRVTGPSKQAASDLAWDTHGVILQIPREPWEGGVVLTVDPVTGPAWLPTADGKPAYAGLYAVTARPRRT